ncbi:MAG: glycine zipper domain-containing protein [Bacteriovoracia bacterium]
MKKSGSKVVWVAALMTVATVQTGCNGGQVGAVVGAIAGAAIGSNNGTGGAIVGAAVGGLVGAAIGTLADEDFYYSGVHYRHVTTYEVREVRYIPSYGNYYVEREYIYVPRYGRHVHVHRWYTDRYRTRCVRQYYVTGIYNSANADQALESLDPSVEENVTRAAQNFGLPEKTTAAILGKSYEAVLTGSGDAVTDIFAKEFSAKADREALVSAFEQGKLEVTDGFAAKVAKSLKKLAGEEITATMAKDFIEASMKAAGAQ